MALSEDAGSPLVPRRSQPQRRLVKTTPADLRTLKVHRNRTLYRTTCRRNSRNRDGETGGRVGASWRENEWTGPKRSAMSSQAQVADLRILHQEGRGDHTNRARSPSSLSTRLIDECGLQRASCLV